MSIWRKERRNEYGIFKTLKKECGTPSFSDVFWSNYEYVNYEFESYWGFYNFYLSRTF